MCTHVTVANPVQQVHCTKQFRLGEACEIDRCVTRCKLWSPAQLNRLLHHTKLHHHFLHKGHTNACIATEHLLYIGCKCGHNSQDTGMDHAWPHHKILAVKGWFLIYAQPTVSCSI